VDAPVRSQATLVDDAELDLATQLRQLRRARNLTLREVATRAGVTESFLSQVERGVASPSVASLQRIARGLGLSIAQLFASPTTAGRVVRSHERRRVTYAGLGAVDEFLTPSTATRLQLILSTIEPGGGTGDEPYSHDSDEEVVLVLDGELDLWVADEHYHLEQGDTVTYSSRLPHRNRNNGTRAARILFSITPPSF
jgi:transcriptional regulator with XRE-family HTH domain